MDSKKILELAQMAGFNWPEISTTTIEERLERFAALIEAEVRGDAEPVGYTNEGYKGMQYANAEAYKDIRPDFIERNKLTAPLYKHPATAVVRKLVEAAERAEDSLLACKQTLKNLDFSMSESSEKVFETVCVELNSALAAAKEAGL